MRLLYLVRHASPAIQPNTPAAEWQLSERGIEEARELGVTAASWGLSALYSSAESKAQATALLLGEATGQAVRVVEGFEELRFDHWIGNSEEFAEAVRSIVEHPGMSFRGAERAEAAATRFERGLSIVEQEQFPAAIVSHGRVLTAWLARRLALEDPFALWRSMPMAGWASIDLDSRPSALIRGFEGG